MATTIQIQMPALSPTMEEGTLARWLVKEGDVVQPGDLIAEIETDKATMEVEAVDEGRVEKILVDAGTTNVQVNTPIAVLSGEADGQDASTVAQVQATESEPEPERNPPINDGDGHASAQQDDDEQKSQKEQPRADRAPNPGVTTVAEPLVADGETVEITMREALRDAMAEEMRRDEDVFLMGEEVAQYEGAYKISQGLLNEFGPERVIDTPITEQGFAGIGVGAAFAGLKPIVEFMTWNFAMQAIDQIINSAAKTHYMSGGQLNAPVVFRGPNGAAARVGAQHSQCYSAWYAHCPGLKVVAPATAADAKGLLVSAIRDPNPVVVLENELLYGEVGPVPTDPNWQVPIGKAKVVREGHDVTIVSFLRGLSYAQEAAQKLQDEDISVEIIDLRSLRPLDMPTVLQSVRKTHRLVTVEEAWPVCSIGSEICAQVVAEAFDDLDAPPYKVAGADVPMPYAANLEKLALPSVDDVITACRAVLYR